MTTHNLTIRELYEMLEPLVDELGDCEVQVRYDGGTTVTPIKNELPYVKHKRNAIPPAVDRVIILEGY